MSVSLSADPLPLSQSPSRRFPYRAAVLIGFSVVYFCAAKLGLAFAFVHANATAVWPPTGIAMAALLQLGSWAWPGVFIGALVANATTAGTLATSSGIAVGNTLEALLGVWLMRRFARGRDAFNRPWDIVTFVGLVALLSTTVSATVGVTSLALGGFASWDGLGPIWFTWWLGDAMGALIFTPLLVLWTAPPPPRLQRARLLELIGVFLAVVLTGHLVFGGWVPFSSQRFPISFFSLPCLLWAAFRFGQRGATAAGLLLAIVALHGTLRGVGPYALANPNDSLLLLQAFIGTATLTALIAAAAVSERSRVETALRHAEHRFRVLIEKSSDTVKLLDQSGTVLYVSPSSHQALGYRPDELVGKDIFQLLHPDERARVEQALAELVQRSDEAVTMELRARHKDGSWRWIDCTGRNLLGDPHVGAVVVNYRDITERKRTEEALAKSEARFQLAVESAPNAMVMTDAHGKIVLVNKQTEALFGYSRDELLGQGIEVLVPARYRRQHPADRAAFTADPRARPMGAGRDLFGLRKDGTEVPVEIGLNPIHTDAGLFILAAIVDITARKQAETQLRGSLREKEVLLKEIHHRVKNNLQVISSLLALQQAALHDPQVEHMVQESQSRIKAMALIHESLYGADDLAHVGVREYLQRLTEHLWRSYGERAQAVALDLEVDRIALTIDTAVPLGLILNELVSNALQHAFPAGHPGRIRIRLHPCGEGRLTLEVSDTGVGAPPDLDIARKHTLGLQLVQALTEQLGGCLSIDRRHGTTVTVVFPESRPHPVPVNHAAGLASGRAPYAGVASEGQWA